MKGWSLMGCVEWSWLAVAHVQAVFERRTHAVVRRWTAQSTVEYALVGALVVIAAAGAMTLLGGEVTSVFSRITSTLSGAAPSGH
jgi:Flp pilus assembly pilin Flp